MDSTITSQHACSAAYGDCRNVGETERWISMFAAGALVAGGLLRGSLPLFGIGAALAYRGYTGHCYVYQAMQYSTAEHDQRSQLIMSE